MALLRGTSRLNKDFIYTFYTGIDTCLGPHNTIYAKVVCMIKTPMKKNRMKSLTLLVVVLLIAGCTQENLNSISQTGDVVLTGVAQTSSQIASGTSFRISGVASDSSGVGNRPGMDRHRGPHPGFMVDGTNLLAPTDELLAIIEAESAGDFRGMRMHMHGGGTVTNYDALGNIVTMPQPVGEGKPEGCSFSGGQFPKSDSLLATIARTTIDFGSGVTEKHDTVSITRSGKVVITRSGTKKNHTETVTFENFKVNGALIQGTKTRITTESKTGTSVSGLSTTTVNDGKITFADGTSAVWTSNRERKTNISLDSTSGRPETGEITTTGGSLVKLSDGTVVYAHLITKEIIESIACHQNHRGPVAGTVQTHYRSNVIEVDFGDGTCENSSISLSINGTTTTKTIH